MPLIKSSLVYTEGERGDSVVVVADAEGSEFFWRAGVVVVVVLLLAAVEEEEEAAEDDIKLIVLKFSCPSFDCCFCVLFVFTVCGL